jgi:hypothetical protein
VWRGVISVEAPEKAVVPIHSSPFGDFAPSRKVIILDAQMRGRSAPEHRSLSAGIVALIDLRKLHSVIVKGEQACPEIWSTANSQDNT